jgi:hypothetical protein
MGVFGNYVILIVGLVAAVNVEDGFHASAEVILHADL